MPCNGTWGSAQGPGEKGACVGRAGGMEGWEQLIPGVEEPMSASHGTKPEVRMPGFNGPEVLAVAGGATLAKAGSFLLCLGKNPPPPH